MANGIPTSIPFLEAAYRERQPAPDQAGANFMRAFERAQERRQEEPERLLRQKLLQQQIQASSIQLADAIRKRDDAIAAEGALTVFSDRIRRAKLLGPSEPSGQKSVIEWIESNRGLLTLPAGKALWEDYLNSVEEDRKNKAQLDEIRLRGESQLAVQAAMGERQLETEERRIAGRRSLEEFKAEKREDLEKLRASLKVSESDGKGKVITREDFVQRHLNSVLRLMPYTSDKEKLRSNVGLATQWLLDDYDEKLKQTPASSSLLAPAPAPAPAPSPEAAVGAPLPVVPKRVRVTGQDGKTYTLPETQVDAFLASPQGAGFKRVQ